MLVATYKELIADGADHDDAIAQVIKPYETALENVADVLSIQSKTLEEAQREQCSWPGYYDARRAELVGLHKYLQLRTDAIRGALTKKYVENYSRDLGERIIAKYIDGEPKYVAACECVLTVEVVLEKYTAVAAAFTKRGYALRDLTTARVEKIHNIQ